MADQNTPQNPPQAQPTPQAPPAPSTSILKDLWTKHGIFFIVVGALLLAAKFGNVVIDLLTMASKKDVDQATKKDAQLKAEEDAANQKANDLVKKANDLPKQETPVDENWDKRK